MSTVKVSFLKISVVTEWDTYHFELKPGETFTLGRSPDCRIPIPRASVSQEHLKITWTGFELQCEDLKSANGTLRMPQESPFLKATFGAKADGITLKLSKSIVELKWEAISKDNQTHVADPTATEVASSDSIEQQNQDPSLNMLDPRSTSLSMGEAKEATKISATQVKEQVKKNTEIKKPPESLPKQLKTSQVVPADEVRDLTQSRVLATSIVKNRDSLTQHRPAATILARKPSQPIFPSAQSIDCAAWLLAIMPSLTLLICSIFVGRLVLGGILEVPRFKLLQGGIHDVVLIYLSLYKFYALEITALIVAMITFTILVQKHLSNSKNFLFYRLAQFIESERYWGVKKYKVIVGLALSLSLIWPALWCHHYGFQFKKIARYNNFLKLTSTANPSEPIQNIIEFKKFLEEFDGSSFLYKHIMIHQRARILDECGGVGEGTSWEKKRNCLVLLEAASIETLQDCRPALLNDVAQRVSILLSLDGIIRTIFVDGRNSTTVGFFLASLEAVGLNAEKDDIQKILDRRDFNDQDVTSFLRDLRKRIELRLDLRQLELGYPNSLYIRVPGPLESGI